MRQQGDRDYGSYRQQGSPNEQQFDPDYQQWRSEQMRNLDDDYRNWRRDRYKKFSEEFTTWRNSRSGSTKPSDSDSANNPGSASMSPGKAK